MKKMSMANGLATGQEWVSKKNVQAWETLFGKELIRPMINPDDLERDMNKLRNLFKEVKCISSSFNFQTFSKRYIDSYLSKSQKSKYLFT